MDVGKLRAPGSSVHTQAIGAVAVHPITPGSVARLTRQYPDLESTSSVDADAVADSILREVCRTQRVEGTAYSERELSTDELTALTDDDRSAIVRFICAAEGWDAAGTTPNESLVRGFRAEAKKIEERERATSEEIRKVVSGAQSALSPDTMTRIVRSTAQLEAMEASLQLPDWLDQMKARQRLYDLQPLGAGLPAMPSHPEGQRSANDDLDGPSARLTAAVELQLRKLDGVAEAQRLALQSQTDMNGTVLAAAQELAIRARASERKANVSFGVAIAAIALSALVSLAQLYESMRSREDSDRQQGRVEAILNEQRDQLKALREQSQQDGGAALREQLGKPAAVATPAAPVVEPPSVAAPTTAKSAKQPANVKRGQKAAR